MIHDSAPHRVSGISELVRLVASHLIPISRKSAVDLACGCRHLEEPVLSTLWETQSSLCVLLKVLPEVTWDHHPFGLVECELRITGDPSPEAWKRVQRYASWMRRIRMNEFSALSQGAFIKFRLNSPVGGWFPALQALSWKTTKSNLPYINLLFSPYLTRISIYVPSLWEPRVPRVFLLAIASAFSALPTPALQLLHVDFGLYMTSRACLKDSLSSVVLRCGPSLVAFKTSIPLSEAAVNHLIQLPYLDSWRIEGPPPNYSVSSLPLVFPPLTELTLGGDVARGWLSLFKRLEGSVPTTKDVTPLFKVKESLKYLNIKKSSLTIIDISFISPIQKFRNLVHLDVAPQCHDEDEGQCTFKLNDRSVTKLAAALPRLKSLLLGHACFENTCATTVACLLPISVRCVQLQTLEIHFNTTNIVDDLKNVSEDSQFQELRSLPRCTLSRLDVYRMPLILEESSFETVANGMLDIFPSLEGCDGLERTWDVLSTRIVQLQKI